MAKILRKLRNIWNKGHGYSHKKLVTRAFPTVSNIEVTNACGMDCIMCPRKHMKRKVGFIDLGLFENIVKQMKQNSGIVLHHFGDPLLHPKMDDLIKICHKYGIKASFSTNPSSLTKENVKKILDVGLDHLHISLDGATKETYEKIRRGRADYDIALKNIEYFLEERKNNGNKLPRVTIAIIRMKETKDEIEAFKSQWEKKDGINQVEVKEFITWDGSSKEIIELGDTYSKKFKRNYYYPCFWPWGKFTVTWDGKVVPCCFDYDAKVILGDLNKQTIQEVWESSAMQEFRRRQLDNSFPEGHLCKNCKEREGFPPSRMFPLNVLLNKRFKFLTYLKHN